MKKHPFPCRNIDCVMCIREDARAHGAKAERAKVVAMVKDAIASWSTELSREGDGAKDALRGILRKVERGDRDKEDGDG